MTRPFPTSIARCQREATRDRVNCGMAFSLLPMMEIGQKVRVYRLRDRVAQGIVDKLGKVGTVADFKMTDGSGVGAVVRFDDKSETWFFEDELEAAN